MFQHWTNGDPEEDSDDKEYMWKDQSENIAPMQNPHYSAIAVNDDRDPKTERQKIADMQVGSQLEFSDTSSPEKEKGEPEVDDDIFTITGPDPKDIVKSEQPLTHRSAHQPIQQEQQDQVNHERVLRMNKRDRQSFGRTQRGSVPKKRSFSQAYPRDRESGLKNKRRKLDREKISAEMLEETLAKRKIITKEEKSPKRSKSFGDLVKEADRVADEMATEAIKTLNDYKFEIGSKKIDLEYKKAPDKIYFRAWWQVRQLQRLKFIDRMRGDFIAIAQCRRMYWDNFTPEGGKQLSQVKEDAMIAKGFALHGLLSDKLIQESILELPNSNAVHHDDNNLGFLDTTYHKEEKILRMGEMRGVAQNLEEKAKQLDTIFRESLNAGMFEDESQIVQDLLTSCQALTKCSEGYKKTLSKRIIHDLSKELEDA